MDQNIVFYDHTADACFKAYGKTLEEAFSYATKALFSLMFDENENSEKINLSVKGKDTKSLLYNYLEELLYILDTEGFISGQAEIKINGNKLEAEIKGMKMTEETKSHGEVKAITYNDMEIGKEKDLYFVKVVVDM